MKISFTLFGSPTIQVRLLLVLLFVCLFQVFSFGQTLVWEENFNGTTINQNHWAFEVGDGCDKGICGWGNGELQYYTNRSENARIEDGSLVIEARREGFQTRNFTSARLKTEGKVHFKYGTVEARIKVPNLQDGLWPALWTLGTVGGAWPAVGEIDIMEMGIREAVLAGLTNRRVGAAVHWEVNNNRGDFGRHYDSPSNLSEGYHIYKMVWTSQFIKVYIDDVEFFNFNISGAAASDLEEFHNRHFLILNLAVGGGYTGITNGNNITAPMPAKMYVDYIKIFQNQGDELYLGSENQIAAGNFGVLTETTPTIARLAFDGDANLFTWNNLNALSNPAAPFEGTEGLAFRAAPGDWFGMGTDHTGKNLAAYKATGSLKFHMKTSSTATFKVGVKNGSTESWVNFTPTGQQYGLVRDGAWHQVTIPLSAFSSPAIDFTNVVSTFMFAGDAPAAAFEFQLDNIYYTTGASFRSGPYVTLTSPEPNQVFTAPASIIINATATDTDGTIARVDFFNGAALIGTDNTSPYSFTWNNAPAGTYTVTAKAYDNEGLMTQSSGRTVFVNTSAITGNYGIFTETTATTQRLNYDGDATLFLWDNTLVPITSPAPSPFEGTEVMAFRENGIGWYGFGITHTAKNLTGYSSGSLKFHMKTTSTGTFKVGIVSGGVESWVNVPNTAQQFGLVRDGNWHQVTIPITAFTGTNFNLGAVTTSFMVASVTAPEAGAQIFFDNIYYTNGTASGNSPTVSITSPAPGATFSAPATINITVAAADMDGTIAKVEFYNGTTLLGTSSTAPFSFTWNNAPAGSHSLTAKAFDNQNLSTTSSVVGVLVNGSTAGGNNFGIFTETTPVVDKLNFDGDANIFLWEGTLSPIANAAAQEGTEVIAVKVNSVGWFGFGIANGNKNLSAYASSGALNFHMKTTAGGTFKVGIKSGAVESWIDFTPNGEQFGLVRDGNWHQVTIPFSRFMNVAGFNMNNINQSFMVASVTAPTTGAELFFDNIYYSPSPLGFKNDVRLSAEVTIFPNPTAGDLHLKSSSSLEGSSAVVYDSMGREVYRGLVKNSTIGVAFLRAGVYSLILTKNGKTAQKRFVKQ